MPFCSDFLLGLSSAQKLDFSVEPAWLDYFSTWLTQARLVSALCGIPSSENVELGDPCSEAG